MTQQIALPNTIGGTYTNRRTLSFPHNGYVNAGAFVSRSGFLNRGVYDNGSNPTGTDDHEPRGMVRNRENDKLYAVFGSRLYSSTGGSLTLVGAMTVPSPVDNDKRNLSFASSYDGIAIATGTANYWLDTSTDTLTQLTDADLPAARSVVYLDGRYIWAAADGETVHFSEVNDAGNVQALSFFDAESRPDLNRELMVIGNDLWVLGETSIERFRNTGTSDAPFVRVTNSVISIGYLGGLVKRGNTATFVGTEEDSGVGIYELTSGRIRRISNGLVDEVINQQYMVKFSDAIIPVKSVRSCAWVDKGHLITAFWFVGSTPVISGGTFFNLCFYHARGPDGVERWGTLSDNPKNVYTDYRDWGEDFFISDAGVVGVSHFTFVNAIDFDGHWYFQREYDLDTSGLYQISFSHGVRGRDSNFEIAPNDEERISKGFRVFIDSLDNQNFEISDVEVRFSIQDSTPAVDNDDKVGVQFSLSGEPGTWTTREEVTLNVSPPGRAVIMKTGGLITTHGYVAMIIESNGEVPMSIDRVIVNTLV